MAIKYNHEKCGFVFVEREDCKLQENVVQYCTHAMIMPSMPAWRRNAVPLQKGGLKKRVFCLRKRFSLLNSTIKLRLSQ